MFTKNLIQYHKTGDVGECPVCGKKLTIEFHKTPIRINCQIRCLNCQKEDYFLGATYADKSQLEKDFEDIKESKVELFKDPKSFSKEE